MEKVRLSGWKALTGIGRDVNTRGIGWVSLAKYRLEKVRLSDREALVGIRREIKTHGVGRVSLAKGKMKG